MICLVSGNDMSVVMRQLFYLEAKPVAGRGNSRHKSRNKKQKPEKFISHNVRFWGLIIYKTFLNFFPI